MIKAIIVDDEQVHRNGMLRHIHWHELGYEVPLEAENAEEALNLARNNHIDVLITDISMPGMNGIELIIEMKTLIPEILSMLISGYDDFEYARSAIGAGAQTYLLKPLNIEEIEKWLNKFRENINIKKKIMQEDENLRKNLTDSIKIAREKFVADLLVESDFGNEYMNKLIKILDLDEAIYIFSLVSIENYVEFIGEKINGLQEITQIIISSIENSFFDFAEIIISKVRSNQLLVIIIKRKENEVNLKGIKDRFQNTVELMQEKQGVLLKIGVGTEESNWNNLYHTYKNATTMFNRERRSVDGQVFSFHILQTGSTSITVDYKEIQDKIETCISTANLDKIDQLIDLAFENFEADKEINLSYIKAFSMRILNEATRVLEALNGQEEKDTNNLFQTLLECQTIGQLKNILLQLVLRFMAKIAECQKTTKSKIIELVEKHLVEHLQDNITVSELAEMVHFNPSYLSVLFKKEVGQTISEYVSRIRLEKAKELLRDPSIKIYEIADKIGYRTAAYFIYQFKKAVGCTPNEFRERRL